MGRNYLELCNDCLDLMFYSPATNFNDLDTTEGRMVKKRLNYVLREICSGEHSIWKFREKDKDFRLVDGRSEYNMVDGFILYIRPQDKSNRIPLLYNNDSEYLPQTATGTPTQYFIYKDKINLYPTPNKTNAGVNYRIHYLTNNFAVDEDGCEKPVMENETDEPIIPEPYRSVLVYGVMKDWRGSISDSQAVFYQKKYNEVYQNMLYSMQMTDDYLKGFRLDTEPMSNLQSMVDAFYNPYVQGSER